MTRLNRATSRFQHNRLIAAGTILLAVTIVVVWYWPEFCLGRAEACLTLRNDQAAARWLKFGSWGQRPSVRSCLVQLRLARRQHRFKDVEQGLQLALQLKVPLSEFQREQWLASAEAQQFDQMQSHWADLLSDPRDDEPEIARNFVTWACGRHMLDDAHQMLEIWHKDYPRDPEPLALRGRLFMASNAHSAAEPVYRQALELAPSNDEYRRNLAEVLREQLKLDEAEALYRDCLQHNPDDRSAISGLAQAYTSQGKIESAIELLKDAVARHPDDLELAQSFGEILLASGDNQSAAAELQRVYQVHPENSDLAYSLAKALKGSGRSSEAEPLFAFVAESREHVDQLKVFEEQLRKNPQDLALRTKIATITAKYKSRQDAIRWYENLLNVSPNHAPTHAALADLYRLVGDETRAGLHAARAASGPSTTPVESPKR